MTHPFKILGVEHIGLAPKDAKLLCTFLSQMLGLKFTDEELVPSQETRTFFFESGRESSTHLEVLEASAPGLGPIASFLAKKGAGIHHIALRVDDLAAALSFLQKQGVELVDKAPRPGAHGSKVAFIHPRACAGVLIELVETTIRSSKHA